LKSYTPFTILVLVNAFFAGTLAWTEYHQHHGLFMGMTAISAVLFGLGHMVPISSYFIRKKPEKAPETNTPDHKLSIILPVKNEESTLRRTLEHLLSGGIEPQHLQFIIINDGSTDGTAGVIAQFIADYPSLDITFVNKSVNQGKKQALLDSIPLSASPYTLLVDSDTLVEKCALKEIMCAFGSEDVAVCGNTRVENTHNLLTKIQDFEYAIMHQLYKSFESQYGAVTCLPGCFTIYKTEFLLEALPKLREQKIFGYPNNHGEDRYLTALALHQSKRVRYQEQAHATTEVPATLSKFWKQRIRWSKSWFLNSLWLTSFYHQKHRAVGFYFYSQLLFPLLTFTAIVYATYAFLDFRIAFLVYIAGISLLYVLFVSAVRRSYLIWIIPFFLLFRLLIYSWIMPVAIFSINKEKWGTR